MTFLPSSAHTSQEKRENNLNSYAMHLMSLSQAKDIQYEVGDDNGVAFLLLISFSAQ